MNPDRARTGHQAGICQEALPEEVAAGHSVSLGVAGLVGAPGREARSVGMSLTAGVAAGISPQHVSVRVGSSEAAGRWRGLWCRAGRWHTSRAG